MGSIDDKVSSKPVQTRGYSQDGGYQRATGLGATKNNNLKQNFQLGKDPSEFKTVNMGAF